MATATGTVEADGTFRVAYANAYGIGTTFAGSQGFLSGKITAGGDVEDAGLVLGDSVVNTVQIKAFGSPENLTIADLYEAGQPETFFRLHRVEE